jgi:arginase
MRIDLLGVPDSAGAYCVGVENAPAALRDAGLVEALRGTGATVVDHGDLTRRTWRPDAGSPLLQNVDDEIAALRELASASAALLGASRRLLTIGGSCTVAVGMAAGMAALGRRPRLVYVDRHLDLNTPQSTADGSLSWMGMAHALALPGTSLEYRAAGDVDPLLLPADLVYLGVDLDSVTPWERMQAEQLGIVVVPQADLCTAPPAAAGRARAALGAGPFLLHLDVDVLDFLDAPLAEDVNGRNSGPSLDQLAEGLRPLWQDDDCWGLSLGQLDPGHARSDPTAIPRLVLALATAASPPADETVAG